MRAVIATHGHCFDGLCSAVLFSHLARARYQADLELEVHGCGYTAEQEPVANLLTGDVNAILDYRFEPSEKLGWYFDHHCTAFERPGARALFERLRGERSFYYDSSYRSCARLVADTAVRSFGIDCSGLEELTHWADKVDSAAFESAEEALDATHPAMRLAAVVERHGDSQLLQELVPALLRSSLSEVMQSPSLQRLSERTQRERTRFRRTLRDNAREMDRVVLVDLADAPLESFGKFVAYALYPRTTYSVLLGNHAAGARINVGYNPWSRRRRQHDLSAICSRYGGGGHPFVGGISFPLGASRKARNVAQSIAAELNA